MKKIISIILSVAMLLSITAGLNLTAYAADASTDFEYEMVDDNSVMVTGYLGNDIDVVIPSEIDGYTVTEIGYFYISNRRLLIQSIIIPDSVTTIWEDTFYSPRFSELKKVVIGNGVVNIGEGAFRGCSSLESVEFGSSMECLLIGMFYGCTSLKNLVLPENIGYIYYDSLPEEIEEIHILNDDCTIEPNSIPYTATIYGNLGSTAEKYANYYGIDFKQEPIICNDYKYIILEDGTAEIIEYLGAGENLEIPSELNGITVTSIADFADVSAKNIVIPDSITKLGSFAFWNCNCISFGNNVKTFGNCAIAGNLNMEINYNGSYDDWMNVEVYNGTGDSFFDYVQYFVLASSGYKLNFKGKPLTEIDYNSDTNLMRFATCVSIEKIMVSESIASLEEIYLFPLLSLVEGYSCDVWILNPDMVCEDSDLKLENARLVCYSGSTAEKYAKENGIPFVAISDAIVDMEYSGASVTLQDDLSLNFKAPKSDVDAVLAEENVSAVYATFDVNGKENKVDAPTVSGENYSFNCPDIAPNMMNDKVNAKLYAVIDGTPVCVDSASYSVADYCYAQLDNTDDEELKTLLVDLLNYGSETQNYTSYKTESLANADLTEKQKSYATADVPELVSILDTEYKTVENSSAEWLGAGLRLDKNISMRLKFSADDISNFYVKVESEYGEWNIPSSQFAESNGNYYVYFDGFSAGQMSMAAYITVYRGDTPVSDTLCYSIETYAAMAQETDDEALKSLVLSMMKYGNSAYAYAN